MVTATPEPRHHFERIHMARNRDAIDNGSHTSAQPPKKKGGCLKLILIGVGLLILLGILGSLMGGNNSNDAAPASPGSGSSAPTGEASESAAAEEADVPAEYTSALRQAKNYDKTMHMSKQGIYDQLTSEYGGQFSEEAAQYAVDNVEADWNANALKKAQDYQEQQAMSPEAIRDQLTSDYGEKFTADEADYAIQNLNG